MHIPDGILPAEICVGGYATTAALTGYALRTIGKQPDPRAYIPRASLLAASFFVASWVHIPIPPASVHLLLNGLLGAILGFYAIPAILVALFFQAVMFGHGGLTTLGVNATIMGGPALVAALLFRMRPAAWHRHRVGLGVSGFLAGAVAPALSVLLFFALLITSIPASTIDPAMERAALIALLVGHIPLIIIEGVFTAMVVLFLQGVRPDLLGLPRSQSQQPAAPPSPSEEAIA